MSVLPIHSLPHYDNLHAWVINKLLCYFIAVCVDFDEFPIFILPFTIFVQNCVYRTLTLKMISKQYEAPFCSRHCASCKKPHNFI